MGLNIRTVMILLCIIISKPSNAQEQYGHFTVLKSFEIAMTQEVTGLQGFTYGRGAFWCITNTGALVKIDTTDGTQIERYQMSIHNETNWFYGAVDFSEDTLWVVATTKIFPLDTLGQQIGEPIQFRRFDTPFRWDIPGLVKENDSFWILQNMPYILFKIDKAGNLLGQFPNAWYSGGSLTLNEDKLIFATDDMTPTNNSDLSAVMTISSTTAEPMDIWDYPNRFRGTAGYVRLLGISSGENCFWSIEETWQDSYQVRKLSIPGSKPMPEFSTIEWGDFEIVDWSYCPVKGGAIEGLYGFEYDQSNNRLWIGEGIGRLFGAEDIAGRFYPFHGLWNDTFTIHRDITVLNDSLWIVQYWPGVRAARLSQISVLENSAISINTEWQTGLAQLDGVANDGQHLWVSGRNSLEITGQPSNEIKKFDISGNELQHFIYPDSSTYNYDDLTWHKKFLWAFSYQSDKAEIHKIDPEDGQIIARYATGWQRPNSNIIGNLASDGDYLLVIGIAADGPPDPFNLSSFENTHERLLKLKPKSSPVSVENKPPNHVFEFSLSQNYPNPFNPNTTIEYSLQTPGHVTITIFNLMGQEVKTLVDASFQPGSYQTVWDGKNHSGHAVSSGLYLYRIETTNFSQTKQLILVR